MVKINSCGNSKSVTKRCSTDFCMKQIPLLSSLDHEQLIEISKGTVKTKYKKGEIVFSQGDKARKLYIVCSGKVKIFRYTPDGKEGILYILSPNDFNFIGAFNLLKEDRFDFYAKAIEDSVICTLDKKDFDDVIIKNPEITLKILEKAYDRINKVESLVDRLTTNNIDAKIAGLLLSLIKDFGIETDDGILLNMTMSREEMGNYTGVARETMSRKLKEMHDKGIINLIGNKKILIKNLDKLRNFIN